MLANPPVPPSVLAHNERFLIEPQHPAWAFFAPVTWWLLPHALAGTCAMLAAPLQFSDRLRRRYAKFHRVTGRIRHRQPGAAGRADGDRAPLRHEAEHRPMNRPSKNTSATALLMGDLVSQLNERRLSR
jgi:hypothetical protein